MLKFKYFKISFIKRC